MFQIGTELAGHIYVTSLQRHWIQFLWVKAQIGVFSCIQDSVQNGDTEHSHVILLYTILQ